MCSIERSLTIIDANSINIEAVLVTADTPVPFSIKQLWFELDDFERQTLKKNRQLDSVYEPIVKGNPENLISNEYPATGLGSSAPFMNHEKKGILSFLNSVRTKLKDSRYSFLFEPGDFTPYLKLSSYFTSRRYLEKIPKLPALQF